MDKKILIIVFVFAAISKGCAFRPFNINDGISSGYNNQNSGTFSLWNNFESAIMGSLNNLLHMQTNFSTGLLNGLKVLETIMNGLLPNAVQLNSKIVDPICWTDNQRQLNEILSKLGLEINKCLKRKDYRAYEETSRAVKVPEEIKTVTRKLVTCVTTKDIGIDNVSACLQQFLYGITPPLKEFLNNLKDKLKEEEPILIECADENINQYGKNLVDKVYNIIQCINI